MKILIIEDDLCMQLVIARAVRMVDKTIEFSWVTNYEDGLKQLASNSYDLCIVDYNLPGKGNGCDIISKFFYKRTLTRFVLTSSLPANEAIQLIDRSNISVSFLKKPFRLNDLTRFLMPLRSVT